jgi:ribose transport system substrate-binding protein
MKRIVGLLAAVLVVASIASCGSDDDPGSTASQAGNSGNVSADEKVEVAFFGFAAANAYSQWALKGAKESAEKLNAEVTFFDGKLQPTPQIAQIQDATASGRYDAFFVLANAAPLIMPALQKAVEQGIVVTAGEYPLGKDLSDLKNQMPGLTSFIGYSIQGEAHTAGQLALAACNDKVGEGEPCKVALIPGIRALPFDGGKLEYMTKEFFPKHPNIEVVVGPDGGFTREGGRKSAQDLMQAHPDTDVVLAYGADPMAIGAEQAIRDANKTPGEDVYLIGLGASFSAVKSIKAGSWYGGQVVQPTTVGRLGVEYAIRAARGEKVPKLVDMLGYASIGPTATKETLAKDPSFKGEWGG